MWKQDSRKVAIVGCGMVGMSYAYALMLRGVCNEILLIDVDKHKAEGEAADLSHGLAYTGSSMKIYAGDYKDCRDADIVCICAGVAQKPGESRLDLLHRNYQVFESIVKPVVSSGFQGIFLVATNPVDIMTRITYELSGFNANKVFGSGTVLDSGRLRYLIGDYLQVDPRNIHAYVLGEHGDSEFVPWSQAYFASTPLMELLEKDAAYCLKDLGQIEDDVRSAAQKIIEAKKATYYGIGTALTRLTRAIFGDEHSVHTVSVRLSGEYGQRDVYAGVPAIINRNGIQKVIELDLDPVERAKFSRSCTTLKENFAGLFK